jgi:hypothetical protein
MQVDEVEVVIDPKDIELSTARSGGAGGGLEWVSPTLSIKVSHIGFFCLSYNTNSIDERVCRSECEQGGNSDRSFSQTYRY